jgi:hypothetical protein
MLQRRRDAPALVLIAVACCASFVAGAQAATSPSYTLETTVIDGAGGTGASHSFTLLSATAQPGITGGGATPAYAAGYGFIPCVAGLLEAGEGEGEIEGEGQPEGEGVPEGEGQPEGTVDGEGSPEGVEEGEGAPEGEGVTEGEGEGTAPGPHTADQNGDGVIDLTELLRVIQFFNIRGFHCVTPPDTSEDGFLPGAGGDQSCSPHDSDYLPRDWQISLTELLRLIQFFNIRAYHPCPGEGTEDGFCPGLA